MKALIIIIMLFIIYKNRNWIKYMWKEHIINSYPDVNVLDEKEPPFCFDCDCVECEDCDAYKAWKIDPVKGWRLWEEMEKRRSYKY